MVSKKVFIFILSIIIIFLSVTFIISDKDIKEFYHDNMLAELFGIIIEIIIIIFIFEMWTIKKQDEKNIIYEKRLRQYLSFFLIHGLKGLNKELKITNFYGKNHKNNKKAIEEIVKNFEFADIDLLHAKNHLMIDKTAIENLLEVASNLTDKHFKCWIRIVYFINSLSLTNDDNKEEIRKNIIDILNNIKKFDEVSFENNIYAGFKKDHFILLKKIGKFFKCE